MERVILRVEVVEVAEVYPGQGDMEGTATGREELAVTLVIVGEDILVYKTKV